MMTYPLPTPNENVAPETAGPIARPKALMLVANPFRAPRTLMLAAVFVRRMMQQGKAKTLADSLASMRANTQKLRIDLGASTLNGIIK